MNHPAENDAELASRLDEAGQYCQPRQGDWSTLVARLSPRSAADTAAGAKATIAPSVRSLRPWWPLVAATAAIVAIVFGAVRFFGPESDVARAMNLDVTVERRAIEVTVFNASDNDEPMLYMPLEKPVASAKQGLGLVKDRRLVMRLKEGDNLVKFTDVAASIDPTSVKLTSETDPDGTRIVEQNFEFDLASADALLKCYIDRRVVCVPRAGGDLVEGYLASFDAEALVLADRLADKDATAPRPKTQALSRRGLKAVRFDSLPDDLVTRPTLVWRLRATTPGDHAMLLSYLCGHMVWQADYVISLQGEPGRDDELDLKGWVSVDNRSGATYREASLKLIAGDVNRVRDPWAPLPQVQEWAFFGPAGGNLPGPSGPVEVKKEFVQRDIFEYKLYALNQPSTVGQSQIKQLNLLQAADVKARRRFRFDPAADAFRASIELIVKNEKENKLGIPLPKGRVTITAVDADGDEQLIGRDEIDHTPKDEEFTLEAGKAFDIACDFAVVDRKQPAQGRVIETYRARVRNHRESTAGVRYIGRLTPATDAQVVESSDPHVRHDAATLYFDFDLAADKEKVITYTVEYRQ